ncbi:hypothetical protein Emed_002608 [Eimeria media]
MGLRITKAACCVLVGLCMHVVFWAPLCLLAGGAVIEPGSEFFDPWDTTAEALSEGVGTSTFSAEQALIRNVENTDLRVLLSNSDVFEEIGAQLEDGVTQDNTEDARKNPRFLATEQKRSHTSRSLTRLYLSVFVALCLFCLALRQKGLPTTRAVERSRNQQEDGVDEILSNRLKVLRALVPVADQLGKAMDTAEARELLKAVHANVPKEGEGDGEGSTIHEASIEKAFSAMRGLQQAAVKEAGGILQMNFDNLSSVSSFLKEWEKGYLGEKEAGELSPLITALRLSQNHFLEVSQHMQEVYDMLEQAQSFEAEQDVTSLLLSTTDSFKFILKLQEERDSAATLALEQRNMAEAAMRMALSRKTSQGFRQRWGELEIAQAYVNIAREAGAAAAEEGDSVAEVQGHLDKAELLLTKYEDELRQLMNYSRSRPHDSISGALTRNITLEQEQESLRASLANYWVTFNNHVKMPGKLEDSGRESVKFVLSQALQRISQDRDTMDVAITSRLSRMAQVFEDPEMNNRLVLSKKQNHDTLQRLMAAEMLSLLGRAEGRIIQLESLLQSLDQEEDTKAAAKMMGDAVASAVESLNELTELRLSFLRINLLISAAQVAKSTMEEATEVSKELRGRITNTSMEPEKLELLFYSVSELKGMLTENYWEARNAAALEDRIKAAGQMQELTFSLRHVLYLVKNNSFPKR